MNTLKTIGDIIKSNNDFVLIPHKNPDGDCMGSVMALARAIKALNKNVKVALVGKFVPKRLEYLWDKSFTFNKLNPETVCITVDVAATYMIDNFKEDILDKAKITCCIDHHGTNTGFADYNYIDANASAAGEIVYELIYNELGVKQDTLIDECLYSAIASDTGSFQYSNTTSKTHIIASKLVENVDSPKIMRNLFEKKQMQSLMFMNDIIQNMEFYYDGRLCLVTIDENMLKKHNMVFSDADEYSSLPRSIDGVEVGAILKVYAEGEVKVSLRSNEYVDVASLAKELGGGGHLRASGVTLKAGADEAKKIMIQKIGEVLKQ